MAKPKAQRQEEARWRKAISDLIASYSCYSDADVKAELARAIRENHDWEIYKLQKTIQERKEWLDMLLGARLSWLTTAFENKSLPEELYQHLSPAWRGRDLDAALPTAEPSRKARPRF